MMLLHGEFDDLLSPLCGCIQGALDHFQRFSSQFGLEAFKVVHFVQCWHHKGQLMSRHVFQGIMHRIIGECHVFQEVMHLIIGDLFFIDGCAFSV